MRIILLHSGLQLTHWIEFKDVALGLCGKEIASGQGPDGMHWLLHDFGTDAKSAFKLQNSQQ